MLLKFVREEAAVGMDQCYQQYKMMTYNQSQL